MVVKIAVKKGGLLKYGYKASHTKLGRYRALNRAVRGTMRKGFTRRQSIVKIMRRLNVLTIYFKNKNPKLSKLFRADMLWLRQKFLRET